VAAAPVAWRISSPAKDEHAHYSFCSRASSVYFSGVIKRSCSLPVAATFLALLLPVCEAAAPGYMTVRTGDMHDFDYFEGAWATHQRRLKARGINSTDWEEFPAALCMSRYLDGLVTVDELWFPTKGWSGLTVRTFDLEKRQWSIYWISSATGQMGTPVVGGFDGDRGEFYGTAEDDGRPVKVRYMWIKIDADHARWEQAFSYDDRAWETNWTADFIRADPAEVCESTASKRPRRSVS
jgi:hypothetical protein